MFCSGHAKCVIITTAFCRFGAYNMWYMGKALYREYRPRTLADVAGQPHITGALERALASGAISHAYLFTGPRGVGKTSVARIIAHQVNRLPYDESSANHLDIIEIDAASNRGIEDVRELRDKVNVAPTSARYKVYIIDEVHMLTTPAFNALLKTLEEPPEHAIFVLATTEAHKVPQTIVSRTQHYAFRPIVTAAIIAHLRHIADTEGIAIDDEALETVAMHGGGSFRDSIGLLDQVRHGGDTITADQVRLLLGVAPDAALQQIIDALSRHDGPALYAVLHEVLGQGITATMLASQLASFLRGTIKRNEYMLPPAVTLQLLKELIDVAPSANPTVALEVILLGQTLAGASVATPRQTPPVPTVTPTPPKTEAPKVRAEKVSKPANESPVSVVQEEPSAEQAESRITVHADAGAVAAFAQTWPAVLQDIKSSHYTLYGVLRMAQADLDEAGVHLHFQFKLHMKKVDDPKNKEIIAVALEKCAGKCFAISCDLDGHETVAVELPVVPEPAPVPASVENVPQPEETDKPESLRTISNIFGGAELLES